MSRASGPSEDLRADAVVVYTGIGGGRIDAAMSLLGEGAGARLLISGVNPEISREELQRLWPGEPAAFECCVDLGREARSTVGNAREARAWAISNGFSSLILVTSDYHMPRALVETRDQLNEIDVTPYRVQSGYLNERGEPANSEAWKKLAIEYSKFLAALVKSWAP